MTSTTAQVLHITSAPEGVLRLFVPETMEVGKGDLRKLAARIAGTIDLGRSPVGKSATVKGVKGHAFDFSPVVHRNRSTSTESADPVDVQDDGKSAEREATATVLRTLGLTPEMIEAALADKFGGKAATVKGTARKSTVKGAEDNRPAFLRKWDNVTCRTCRDFGKVRGASAGDKAGKPFRTQRGADSAPTAVPCPQHQTAGGRKGRKSA